MCGRYNKISSDDMDADGVVQPNPQDFTYFYAEPECREIVVYEDLCQYQPQLVCVTLLVVFVWIFLMALDLNYH